MRPAPIESSTSFRAVMSNASCNTSRYVSTRIGKLGKRRTASSRSSALSRCSHSGIRRFGDPRGKSSARAAFMRKRAPNSDVLPTSFITRVSASSAERCRSAESGAVVPRLGSRSMIPSSVVCTCTSIPGSASRTRCASAIPQGAFTRPPNTECRMIRTAPISSRNCSMTIVRSSGTTPVDARCSAIYERSDCAHAASTP